MGVTTATMLPLIIMPIPNLMVDYFSAAEYFAHLERQAFYRNLVQCQSLPSAQVQLGTKV